MNAFDILPRPQGEQFMFPPVCEFKVYPKAHVKHVSDKVTCELRITAGKTKLITPKRFHHDFPASYCKI